MLYRCCSVTELLFPANIQYLMYPLEQHPKQHSVIAMTVSIVSEKIVRIFCSNAQLLYRFSHNLSLRVTFSEKRRVSPLEILGMPEMLFRSNYSKIVLRRFCTRPTQHSRMLIPRTTSNVVTSGFHGILKQVRLPQVWSYAFV